MLFHGKNLINARGILKDGYRNYEGGYHGEGLYNTEIMDIAFHYSHIRSCCSNAKSAVFINEVLNSDDLFYLITTLIWNKLKRHSNVKLLRSTLTSIVLRQLQMTTSKMNVEDNTEELQPASGASGMSLLQTQIL